MKYAVINDKTRAVMWDPYFEYLHSQRASFPEALYEYACDWSHYSLDSKSSLHDAWLELIDLRQTDPPVPISLSLQYLGPYHDRTFKFAYTGVTELTIDIGANFRTKDRDVFAHEFRLEDGLLFHEVAFASGGTLLVSFVDLSVSETMLEGPEAP